MKDSRFDSLTVSMAAGKSRRGLLKGLFGMVVGGAVATVATDNANAAARGGGETCRKGGDCLSGVCAVGSDGRRRCCNQECYNCGAFNTETCCDNLCTS